MVGWKRYVGVCEKERLVTKEVLPAAVGFGEAWIKEDDEKKARADLAGRRREEERRMDEATVDGF